MKSLRILLIGIGGVYNYGCEGIVRGTEVIIRREYPNAEIVYVSRRVADDEKRLKGSGVRVIERAPHRRYSAQNIGRKLLSLIGIKWSPMTESLELLDNVDAVFSIGGDIYTLGPSGDYNMGFPRFGDAVVKRGVPYILWGASVGPFTGNPKVEKAFKKHLGNLSLITAREAATIDYLKSLGVSANVVSCADPAYVVEPEVRATGICQEVDFTIGINLSPLSVRHTGLPEEEAIHTQARTIEGLIAKFNARVVLIPHVVSDFNEGDDDLRYLLKVQKAVVFEYQNSLTLLESDPGFIGTKMELIKCNLVIAARMHCAINALTAQIPTIILAYSRKAEGMCQYVYGNDNWVLPLSDFTKEGVIENKVLNMKNHEINVRDYLSKRIPEIQQETLLPLQRLKVMLG